MRGRQKKQHQKPAPFIERNAKGCGTQDRPIASSVLLPPRMGHPPPGKLETRKQKQEKGQGKNPTAGLKESQHPHPETRRVRHPARAAGWGGDACPRTRANPPQEWGTQRRFSELRRGHPPGVE